MDDTLLGSDRAQLLLTGDGPPEAAHIGSDRLEGPAGNHGSESIDRRYADLSAATKGECQSVPLEPVFGVGPLYDVRGGIVRCGVHRVRAGKGPRGRKSHVVGCDADDAAHVSP